MKIIIEQVDNRWMVNNKPFAEMSDMEKELLNTFFKEYKKDSNYIK